MFITDQYWLTLSPLFWVAVIPDYNAWVRVDDAEGLQAFHDVLKEQVGL